MKLLRRKTNIVYDKMALCGNRIHQYQAISMHGILSEQSYDRFII